MGRGVKDSAAQSWWFPSGTGCHCTLFFLCTILSPYKTRVHSDPGNSAQFLSLLPMKAEWSQRRHREEQMKWPGAWSRRLGKRDQNSWGLCFGEEDVRKLYRLTKAVDKVKAELLLTKWHGAGGVQREGTAESRTGSHALPKYHLLLAPHGTESWAMGNIALTRWVITFICVSVLSQKSSLYGDVSHEWKPMAVQFQQAPAIPHLQPSLISVYTSGQAGSRHPLSTDSFLQPQNCSSVI